MNDAYPQVRVDDVDPTNVLGRRVLAHCIDLSVLMGVMIPIMLMQAKVHESVGSGFCDDRGGSANCFQSGNVAVELPNGTTGFTVAIIAYWIVVGAIEGATGAFVGKRAVGLRVVAQEGGRAGVGRGMLRGVVMFVDSTFCFLVGLITASTTRSHRRLGDMAARTLVMHRDNAERFSEDSAMVWDETLQCYVHTDPLTGHRQRWDETSNSWIAL